MIKKISLAVLLFLTSNLPAVSQTVNYEVYALKYADVGVTLPLSLLVLDAPPTETIDAVFLFWVLKGSNGKNIMVDAGFLEDIEQAKAYSVTNYVRPDLMLSGIGLKAEDISDIILTHPHWDHMDGVDLFPNAKVWMQKEDYNYFVADAWQKEGWGDFNQRDVRKIVELNLAGRLVLIEGDNKEIFPNIKVYTGSKHSFESQFVWIDNGVHKIILASDNVYTYYNLEHLISAPKNETFDTRAYVRSMERMKTLIPDTKYIVPGHDKLLLSNFPMIAKDIIQID